MDNRSTIANKPSCPFINEDVSGHPTSARPSVKAALIVFLASAMYLVVCALLMDLKTEHWLIIGVYNALFLSSPKTRKFAVAFSIFLVFGIMYDLMKVYPNYLVNQVDIEALYRFEQQCFGFKVHHQWMTPNEFFACYHAGWLDLITGIFYLNWVPAPLIFGLYLFIRDKQLFLHFALTFLFVNLLGFSAYYLHPAAPPWYVSLYGFNFYPDVPGNVAGLARFDKLLHVSIFDFIYARNSNVFAALPSLHCAYPVIVGFYARKHGVRWILWLSGLFMVGIWFSAIYSGHHYVTDVILGVLCAIAGIAMYQQGLLRIPVFQTFVRRYAQIIT